MNEENYVYYAYRTVVLSDTDIEWFFRNGITNHEGNDIKQIMLPIDLKNITPEEYINSLISGNYNAVVVVKFPKDYFKPDIFYGQLKQLPLPIWKEEVHGYGETVSSLDSNYIYRIYYKDKSKDDTKYVNNENYTPINDPVGKQYDTDQLNTLLDMRAEKLFDFGVARRRKTYEELCREDLANKTWDTPVLYLKDEYEKKGPFRLNKTF